MGFSKKPADKRAAAPAPAPSASPALEDPSSSTTTTASFFSRFSLPLRSRTRYIADFHIRPAEPHRRYAAGDQVQGAVVLTVVKPVRITHLVVSLHGYMRVYKGPNVPANEPIIDPSDALTNSGRNSRQRTLGNGCVRLFQDEQTLSGDGRLEPGRYEFNFNLLFPAEGLPSSIDFERGTISYLITATLTRPMSMGSKTPPKTSCERKVYLVEKVDIGALTPPRPRTIYLEPISKRPKKKKQPPVPVPEKGAVATTDAALSLSVSPTAPAPSSDQDPARANENSTEGSLSVIGEEELELEPAGNSHRGPQSDVRSLSSESAISGSTGRSKGGDAIHPVTTASTAGKKVPAVRERTITATVELLKGGCLQGDTVPIKISVQHIRRIKSMHGVIVTLYRLGRIDSSPLSLSKELPEAEARRLEKEEYYPRSKTGLGGLSLSSAGSCSVFRKDLSQAFAPLIIDPDTLTANLTASVRVPEDVFPTIKDVPHEMISFKYHVEVIVDLGGKLANQIQGIKPAATRMSPVAGALGAMTGGAFDGGAVASWGTNLIDTDTLRRQKGVICVVFEVVVGTTDSSRVRGKAPAKPGPFISTVTVQDTPEAEMHDPGRDAKQPRPAASDANDGYSPDSYAQDYSLPRHPQAPRPYPFWDTAPSEPPPAPHYIPPPDVADESTLTEKERIQRAEQRLLPSAPPPDAGPSTSHLPTGENIYDADDQPAPSQPNPPDATLENQDPLTAPSAPTLDDLAAGHDAHPTEDKQELERRRLLAEASAPPEFPEDYDNGAGSSSTAAAAAAAAAAGPSAPSAPPGGPSAPPAADLEPSAPVLGDEEEEAYGLHYAYRGVREGGSGREGEGEELPRYER